VVVTGSRIAQPNLETTSPVTQVTAEDVITQGVTKIEDLINQLPQAFAAQNGTVSNGATGTATVNLRGLGSARTLVLIDGRRMPAGGVTSGSYAADLNQIPTAMVERVEVLTGGASAVYGSDAVAGVVNFIMKKNFEGIQIDGQYAMYQHNNSFSGPGAVQLRDTIAARHATNPSQFNLPDDNVTDGNGVQGTITMGVSTEDGRGNITAYLSYQDNKPVLQRDRDYSACALAANPTVSFACGGSGTAFPGTFTSFGGNSNAIPGPDGKVGTADDVRPDTNPLPDFNSTVDSATGNTFRAFNNATDQYNFGPTNYYLRPDTRYSLGAMGHYELAPFADVYTQLMFTDVRSVAQIAAGGAFFNTGTINCDNPFLSAQQATTIGCGAAATAATTTINPDTGEPFLADANVVPMYLGRRNIEGGGRQSQFHNQSFRTLLGSRGDIAEGWNYDVSVQFSRTTADQSGINDFVVPNLQNASARRPRSGDGQHRLRLGARWLGSELRSLQPVRHRRCDSGSAELPAGAGGAVGRDRPEHRHRRHHRRPGHDRCEAAVGGRVDQGRVRCREPPRAPPRTPRTTSDERLLGGSGGRRSASRLDQRERRLRGSERSDGAGQDRLEQLSFDTAYRYSDYSSGITTDTYKFGWTTRRSKTSASAPASSVRSRAPNIVELFTAQGFNLFDIDGDPCGASPAPGRRDDAVLERRRAGVRSPVRSSAGQPGGSVQLQPGRQPGSQARDVGHSLLRYRVHAALRAWPERLVGLLRHQGRRPDLGVRSG
jgi:outer membrane receptor protein involved in Fe transport